MKFLLTSAGIKNAIQENTQVQANAAVAKPSC